VPSDGTTYPTQIPPPIQGSFRASFPRGRRRGREMPANRRFLTVPLKYTPPITSPTGSRKDRADLRTLHGHPLDEAASSLQKSIRRSQEEDALYWAAQLDTGGFPHYLWRRLYVIAAEDIGLEDPDAIVRVRAWHEAWRELTAKKGQEYNARLFMALAALYLARAPKSRLINDATIIWEEIATADLAYRREPPDHALDMHTKRGRQMGRSYEQFFDESSRLINPDGTDVTRRGDDYERRVLEMWHPDHKGDR
jgi:hypothetical protein